MPAMVFDLVVFYEDGTDVEVRADQRDFAAFETKFRMGWTKALEELTATFYRYVAWAAMRRTGALDLTSATSTWEAWGNQVVSVEDKVVEPEAADPGSPEAPAATS